MDWIFLTTRTDLFDGSAKSMLHVAPEPCFSQIFLGMEKLEYLSADLTPRHAMVQMDITDIQYPDNYFSVIYCSHVLEHIQDDRKALSELYRVLRPGGWALLQVPITADQTYEDPNITDPSERKKHFGQWDHVRCCGPEYVERMAEAGFTTQILKGRDIATDGERRRMAFYEDGVIFLCRKTLPQ